MTTAFVSTEQWTVNGLELICPAWSFDPAKGGKGLVLTPELRDNSVVIPGRRGVLPGGVEYDAGQLVCNFWVLGVDETTGDAPGSWAASRMLLECNLSQLTAAFYAPRLALQRNRLDGEVRCAEGSLAQATDPEIENTYPAYATLSVAVRIDGAFWRDRDPSFADLTAVTDTPVPLYEFSGSTAPLDDLVYVIGPAWNPTIADVGGSGTWLAYDAVIPDGQALIYDGETQQVSGGGGLIVDQTRVRRGRRLALSPGNPPMLSVSSSGPNPVNVQVSGRRAFLTA